MKKCAEWGTGDIDASVKQGDIPCMHSLASKKFPNTIAKLEQIAKQREEGSKQDGAKSQFRRLLSDSGMSQIC
jgi:hypothetical protein